MKVLIIILIFLGHFLIPLPSNDTNNFNDDDLGVLYDELGTASTELSDTEYIEVSVSVFKKQVDHNTQKSFRNFNDVVYRYNIVCISNSEFNGELTSTWLYGFWVKVNGVTITKPLYPDGKDVMVYTTPTVVHYIETEEENPTFNVGWVESVYEPKIIK